MVNRPSFIGYWAQDALPADIGDADVFIPSNPAYPEQVANQYTTGWFVTPDVDDVKQPHQWMNSWLQSTDYQLHAWHEGDAAWAPEIEYMAGAGVSYAGKRYIAKSNSTGVTPTVDGLVWDEVAFYQSSDALAAYAAYESSWNSHKNRRDNPHNVTVPQINGMSKADIDAAVASKDAAGKQHIGLVNNPHEVTYTQLGILPVAGGVHTGPTHVTTIIFPSNKELRKRLDKVELINGSHSLAVTDGGLIVLNAKELLSEANYKALRAKYSELFKVPAADFHLPLTNDINGYNSSFAGATYQSSDSLLYIGKDGLAKAAEVDAPAFGVGGLQLSSTVTQSLNLPIKNVQGTISMILDNGTCMVGQGNLSKTNVLGYIITTELAVKDIKVWYTLLTPYQIAALGCNA